MVKKISSFEHAINVACGFGHLSDECHVMTQDEEREKREAHLRKQMSRMRIQSTGEKLQTETVEEVIQQSRKT